MTDQSPIEREKKARTIIDKAYDAFVEIDINSIIIDWNHQAETMFGWARQEALGQKLTEIIIPPTYREAHLRGLKRFEATGEGNVINRIVEVPALHRDGHELPVELAIFPILADGATTFCAFIRDISDRKRTALALAEGEESFRLLISGVKDYAIYMLDPQGHIMTWNEGAERINGYKAEEIVGKHFSCFYTEEDKDKQKPQQELETAIAEERYEETGIRVRQDGSSFWANVLITPLYDQNNQLKGFAKVTRDITELKIAADSLQEQADMLNLTYDAIIMRDLDGIIRYWNSGAERMYGFTKEQAKGRVTHHLLNTHFSKPLIEIEQELFKNRHWEGELLHYTSDQRRLIVSSRQAVKYSAHGKPIGILEINSDITVHKQAEQRRLALAEMKRVNTELEQFAYIASHDLQEPLRAVAGGLQILEKKYRGKLDSEADELITMAVDGATRMRTLITDLLSLSQVNRSKDTAAPTDLLDILDQAMSNLAIAIQESRAKITYDPLPTLVIEKGLLVQLFQNLISNAIKFHSNEEPHIHFGVHHEDEHWRFSISDNGIGFQQEFAERVFEPFKRLQGRDKYPGTGIGLAICKKIVERHSGRIWVESQPEKGTTFYFTLPDSNKNPDE